MNLIYLLLIPLLTSLLLLFMRGHQQVRAVALAGSALQWILSIWLLISFRQARLNDTEPMLFQQSYAWFPNWGINFHIGVDGISVAMIVLTAFVVLAGVLVSWKSESLSKEFFFLLQLLSLGAYGFFVSLDLFTLFFFLEIAVIPKFMLIGIWGSGKKEYSALKLALMLMAGSALVFIGLAGLYFNTQSVDGVFSFNMLEIAQTQIPFQAQLLFFPFAFVGFGIFTALFPFHTWVPDGHASAPTAASMFLAGISMKLGGYGCLRVATWLMPDAAHYYAPVIIVLATIAIIYGAFATLMQTDLKYINAYSSVSHCGFVLLGIGMLSQTSITGAVLQMVSHGLMTALFFACIGMIYERTHTREVKRMTGLLKSIPMLSTVFVIVGLCSLGLPGLSGFVAEMMVLVGAWQNPGQFYRIATILACASIVVTAVYILRVVGKIIMGPEDQKFAGFKDALWNEKLALAMLLIAIVIMGVTPFWITNLVEPGSAEIMNALEKAISVK